MFPSESSGASELAGLKTYDQIHRTIKNTKDLTIYAIRSAYAIMIHFAFASLCLHPPWRPDPPCPSCDQIHFDAQIHLAQVATDPLYAHIHLA